MSAFARCFLSDMRRAVRGRGFYVAVFCACFSVIQPVWREARMYAAYPEAGMDVVTLYGLAGGMSMQAVLVIAGAAAFSCSFLQDVENRFYRPMILRAGRVKYIVARVLAVCGVSFIAVLLGQIIACLLLNIKISLYIPNGMSHNEAESSASELLTSGKPVAFLLLRMSFRAFYVSMWALSALGISAYVSNRFVVVFSPLLLSYGYAFFESTFADLSKTYRMEALIRGRTFLYEPLAAAWAVMQKCLPLWIAFMLLSVYGMGRRLKNG